MTLRKLAGLICLKGFRAILSIEFPCLLVLAFSGQELFADTNIAGLWKAAQTRDDGSVDETYYRLEQSGAEIKGAVQMDWGDLTITKGMIQRTEFHFEAISLSFPWKYPWRYDGVVENGRLKITLHYPNPRVNPYEMIAVKVSGGGPEVPVRIPPPALHKVPYNGLAKTPPMGWNSWNHFQERVDDATVRAIADAMVANGMHDAGYVYVNIDASWEGSRDAQGNIHSNKKFPDMKALADYVHSRGLKLGIYSSPGPKTCANYEGSYGHEEQDAKTYAAWGIDYLKYDWCSASRIYKHSELRAIYQKMGDALESTGRPIVYSLCEYGMEKVWEWGPLVGGNLWRTTADIEDTWESMSEIGFNQGMLAPYVAPGHWNDPDMLEIGNGGMTAEEYRTHMSLWSMLSAPLIAGNDLRSMSPEILGILINRDVIAIDQDPLGKQATRVAKSGEIEIWKKTLTNGEEAVAIFNRGADEAKYEVRWADLGLARPSKARDLWSHQDITNAADAWPVVIPGHGTVLLRISAK